MTSSPQSAPYEDRPESKLFLSCDLVGSTAFKQSNSSWQRVFLSFYRQFPQMLEEQIQRKRDEVGADNFDVDLVLWKPIGDELVFTVVVRDETSIRHAIDAWLEAMSEYERGPLKHFPLMTKGGAFLAVFPAPDDMVSIPRLAAVEDSYRAPEILNREAINASNADQYIFDYCGPSIDTGFRIINACSERFFTLSLEVAWAYMAAYEARTADSYEPLTFLGKKPFKGVWGGREYPLFAMDRHCTEDVNRAIRNLEKTGSLTLQEVDRLARACRRTDGWHGAIYLPNSDRAEFKHCVPVAPDLPAENEMEGAESPPPEKQARPIGEGPSGAEEEE